MVTVKKQCDLGDERCGGRLRFLNFMFNRTLVACLISFYNNFLTMYLDYVCALLSLFHYELLLVHFIRNIFNNFNFMTFFQM